MKKKEHHKEHKHKEHHKEEKHHMMDKKMPSAAHIPGKKHKHEKK